MSTVSNLVAEIQKSFDVDPTDALALLDRRHKQMCESAGWWREERIGGVVTSVSSHGRQIALLAMPLDSVEIFSIRLFDQSTGLYTTYSPTRTHDYDALVAGTAVITGGGVFIDRHQTTLDVVTVANQLEMFPPVATNTQAVIDGVFTPPTLTADESLDGFVRVPASFFSGLLAGVYADLLNRPNEARPDLANVQEALFQQRVQELRAEANRRFRTKGPRQIRLAV